MFETRAPKKIDTNLPVIVEHATEWKLCFYSIHNFNHTDQHTRTSRVRRWGRFRQTVIERELIVTRFMTSPFIILVPKVCLSSQVLFILILKFGEHTPGYSSFLFDQWTTQKQFSDI